MISSFFLIPCGSAESNVLRPFSANISRSCLGYTFLNNLLVFLLVMKIDDVYTETEEEKMLRKFEGKLFAMLRRKVPAGTSFKGD